MLTWLTGGIEGPLTALLALCAVAGAVVLLRRWQHRTGATRGATVESRADRREADSVHRSLVELLAEVERTTTRLDERVAARLRELEAAESRVEARLAELRETSRDREYPLQTVAVPEAASAADAASRIADAPRAAATSPAPPRPGAAIIARSTKPIEPDARFAPLYSLADTGASHAAIAEKSGLPLGEVEMILGLRRLAAAPD